MFRLLLRGEHEVAQLALVVGRSNDEMRNGAQGGNVEHPMVGGTILAHESGTIETEHHGQI